MDFKLDPPVHENTPQFSAWVARQFERVTEAFTNTQEERKGVTSVTGSLVIPTGLKKVQYCHACFSNDPNAGAMALACRPDVTAGAILVKVFANSLSSMAVSTTPINVAWFAYGFS